MQALAGRAAQLLLLALAGWTMAGCAVKRTTSCSQACLAKWAKGKEMEKRKRKERKNLSLFPNKLLYGIFSKLFWFKKLGTQGNK